MSLSFQVMSLVDDYAWPRNGITEYIKEKDFSDDTLITDDDRSIIHKMILIASSPFFKNILTQTTHSFGILVCASLVFIRDRLFQQSRLPTLCFFSDLVLLIEP